MRYFHIIICVFLFLLSSAQGFRTWHYLPGAKTSMSKAIFETSPGTYITGGITVDSVKGIYCYRLCLMGLNTQGQILWEKEYGHSKFQYLDNPFISRCFYKQGNHVYFAGAALDSNGKYLGVLIKFNLNGDTLWQRKFYDSNDYVYPQMVTGSVDNGFLITGMFEDPLNVGRTAMLIKTNANGQELWRKKISKASPNVNDGKAIVQDSATKKIVIVGYQYPYGASVFDNVLILDSLGTKQGQYSYETNGGQLLDLIQTRDKILIGVGVAFYPQTLGGYNLQRSYIVKFDLNNPTTPVWKINDFDKLTLYNGFTCVRELANGDLLVGGFFDTLILSNINPNLLTRIVRIDKNGNTLWKRYYNYKTNAPNRDNGQTIKSLELTGDGGCVAAIECQNFPNPNPFLFVKYDSLGCDSTLAYCVQVAASISKNYLGATGIQLYPNPGNGLFHLSFPNMVPGDEVALRVTDVSGREVKNISFRSGTEYRDMDLRELSNGVYTIDIRKNRELIYKTRLIKQE